MRCLVESGSLPLHYMWACIQLSNRFERELEALRKELAEVAASRSGAATPADETRPSHSRTSSDDESVNGGSPMMIARDLQPHELVPTPIDAMSTKSDSSLHDVPDAKKDE